MKNILLLSGGGGSEHEISLISSKYIASKIDKNLFRVINIEVSKDFNWLYEGSRCELNFNKEIVTEDQKIQIHCAIPCFHGHPGETGDIQSLFELIKLPYFGCSPETSVLCFNKLATKLVLEMYGVKTTPFISINNTSEIELLRAETFFDQHKVIYVKATNQGSSVGCYKISKVEELREAVEAAFKFSPFVILEKEIKGRELEVAVFEYNNKMMVTSPGEIICPDDFYTYEEKYNKNSKTITKTIAPNISESDLTTIKKQSEIAFQALKLRHLSRIDFFLSEDNEVLINEINTFPGHTQISMFPSMLENTGIKYSDFINSHLKALSKTSV
mgnify:CR=1 FL=1